MFPADAPPGAEASNEANDNVPTSNDVADDKDLIEGRKPTIRLDAEPKQKEEDQPKPFPLADPGQYYVGLWSGLPLFGCPFCPYTCLESDGGDGQIELHILYRIDAGNEAHRKALDTEGGLA